MEQLRKRLERSGRLFRDLVAALTPEQLASDLGGLPSNTIGAQLWCVVGARESYVRAARAGSWQGFSCETWTQDTRTPADIVDVLTATAADVAAVAADAPANSPAETFLFDLLEHEAQHHGQLIRYMYALGIERPASWRERYALT